MTNLELSKGGSARDFLSRIESDRRFRDVSGAVRWLGIMVFLLLAAPKLRIMVGPAPLYVIDGIIAFLLLSAKRIPSVNRPALKPFPALVSLYLIFIYIGEFRGFVIYGKIFESIYIMGEFTLGVSMFFIVPRLVRDAEATALVLKAIIAGLLCCSAVTIMYSLAPTRPFVMNTILSYKFLVPEAESLAQKTLYYGGVTEAMRGQSLIGTSTITTGFLGTMWGFTFLAANWPGIDGRWRLMAHVAAIATPIAMLMTYGRAAWLTVIVLGVMSILFGFAKSRRNAVILVIGLAVVAIKFGWQSELFMVDRVIEKSQVTLEDPYADESFSPRLLSFTSPFSHLLEHPLWLVAGTGRVGQKLSARGDLVAELYDAAGLSNHSGFGMAYYCYGLLAAIIHALLMLNGFKLIWKRLRGNPPEGMPLYKITWQTFLMTWVGLLCWWLPGHAMVGEARGVILFFFFYGFMMSCDRMSADPANEGLPQ